MIQLIKGMKVSSDPQHQYFEIFEKGQEVLLSEAKALTILAQELDERFDQAVKIIDQTVGHLIVSGVGKSGHVGRKMAATFASTGQPAFFVHAAEAGHGDLGMITKNDTLLLISYSGQAKELLPMLSYAHRFDIPIISITSKQDSVLAQHSNVVLLLPDVGEACPMGLAPTTSTTLTMGLGDALAVALLSLRGFSKADFNTFHPGGNLGFKLQKIQDFMHTGVDMPIVNEDASLHACLQIIAESKLGCVGVMDDKQQLQGVLTDGDIRRIMQKMLASPNDFETFSRAIAKDVMIKNPKTIYENALLGDALALFEKHAITNIFVINDNKQVMGLLHIHDCLRGKAI